MASNTLGGSLSNIWIGLIGLLIVLIVAIAIMGDFLPSMPFITPQDSANLESTSTTLSWAIPFLMLIVAVGLVSSLFHRG